MEGMREIARSYRSRESNDEKKSIKESFNKLDVNGDGRISLLEFKKSVTSWLHAEAAVKLLARNGDGSLDFNEYLCFHYMEKKMDIAGCSRCSELLVGPYFSCLLCMGKGAHSYDLCCSCYRHRTDRSISRHEHSSDYMMDHHSLLKVFRDRTAAAENFPNKKEMEELREVATAHLRAGSPQVHALAYEFYKTMDSDGDGRVDFSEFLAFMRQQGHCYSYMQNPNFFNELDLDGSGNLDFSEVMTLYYIIKSGRPFCKHCGKFIPGIFFSCVECFKNPKTMFDLCRHCYRAKKWDHSHNGRTLFLDNYTLLQAMRDPTSRPQTSGVNFMNEAGNKPSNAIVPLQRHDMHIYPTYNTTVVQPHNALALVPASSVSNSNWNKWSVALAALEVAVSIGSVSGTLCTIL